MIDKKPFFRISIRVTILTTLLFLIFFVAGIMMLVQYTSSAVSTYFFVDKVMSTTSERVVDQSIHYLQTAVAGIQLSSSLAAEKILKTNNQEQLTLYFRKLLSLYSQFTMINYGDTKGNFLMVKKMPDGSFSTKIIQRNSTTKVNWNHQNPAYANKFPNEEHPLNEGYDPRKRSWYQNAQKLGKVNWTEVYIFYTDKEPGISCSAPVYDKDKNFVGVVSIDISIVDLSYFLGRLEIAQQGHAFIFNQQREIIALSIEKKQELQKFIRIRNLGKEQKHQLTPVMHLDNKIYQQAVIHLEEKIIREKKWRSFFHRKVDYIPKVLKKRNKMASSHVRFSFEGVDYFAMFKAFPPETGWDWTISLVVPANYFIAHVWWTLLTAFVFSIVLVLLACWIGIWLSHKISTPLANLQQEMDKVRSLNLNSDEKVSSIFQEVDVIANSFWQMKLGLRSFEKYVPSDLVKALLLEHKEAILGGERKQITIYFSDIAGFTSIAEQLTSEELVQELGVYLSQMSEIIHEHQGTVDKFIGDAIMAFWGAPKNIENHAYLACCAAISCQKQLSELQAERIAAGKPIFQSRIGIHTGDAIVGNIGSEKRMDYTAIGDAVNLASRLESINKYYATQVIISEDTFLACGDQIQARKMDLVAVKGKKEAVTIYELMGIKNKDTSHRDNFISLSNEGFESYLRQDWVQAIQAFQQVLQLYPQDPIARIFIQRCQEMQKNPPSPDWTGVFIAQTKDGKK